MARHTRRTIQQSDHNDYINPFAWYRRKRLPFGLKVSSEIFRASLKGVFSLVDDVVVAACGQTMEEAQIDNRQELTETFERCAEINIVLNEDKQQTGLIAITFHGHRITKDGATADKSKCKLSTTCQRLLM